MVREQSLWYTRLACTSTWPVDPSIHSWHYLSSLLHQMYPVSHPLSYSQHPSDLHPHTPDNDITYPLYCFRCIQSPTHSHIHNTLRSSILTLLTLLILFIASDVSSLHPLSYSQHPSDFQPQWIKYPKSVLSSVISAFIFPPNHHYHVSFFIINFTSLFIFFSKG